MELRIIVGGAGLVVGLIAACDGGHPSGGQKSTSAVPASRTASASPTSSPMAAQELQWIQAVGQLPEKMNKAFVGSPTNLTAAALKSMADQLRGCRRELTRLGNPGARLMPAYRLVEQACTAYDKGAACFVDAARGLDSPGSAIARQLEKKIRCGFDSSGLGGTPLIQAQTKASQIKAAAG